VIASYEWVDMGWGRRERHHMKWLLCTNCVLASVWVERLVYEMEHMAEKFGTPAVEAEEKDDEQHA
jgi:hypothetical protein